MHKKITSKKSLRPVNELCKFLHFNTEFIDQKLKKKNCELIEIKYVNLFHND